MRRRSLDALTHCPTCGQSLALRQRRRHQAPDLTWCKGPPRTRRPKGWSVSDADHIRIGERVIISGDSLGALASFRLCSTILGGLLTEGDQITLYGRIKHRYHGSGDYMVWMEGADGLEIAFARSDLVWPIDDGIVPFSRDAAMARRSRRLAMGIR